MGGESAWPVEVLFFYFFFFIFLHFIRGGRIREEDGSRQGTDKTRQDKRRYDRGEPIGEKKRERKVKRKRKG